MDWITAYLEMMQETEPPPEFNRWCAVAGIGHVLGRKVWLDQYLFKVYPGQVMVLLCSDSAVARKTIAMRNVERLIATLPEECWNTIPQRVSGATILDALNRIDDAGDPLDAVGLVFAEELGTFFSREQGRQDIPTLVTELNDAKEGPWRAPTRTYGDVVLWNPCVGMVAGVTRTGLAREVPQIVRRTGFLGRTIVVDSDGSGHPNSLTEPPRKFDRLRALLIKDLYRIASLQGPMVWSAEGKEWYDEWYSRHFYKVKAMEHGEATGWFGRKHIHVLRTAMILACAASSALVYTVEVLEKALQWLQAIEQRLPQAMREIGVNVDDQQRKDRLIAKLDVLGAKNGHGGWVDQRRLFSYLHRGYPTLLGGYELYRRDLHDAEHAGTVTRRVDDKGQHPEWKVAKTSGQMLRAVK